MRFSQMIDLASFFYQQRVKGFPAPTQAWLDPEALAWFEAKLGQAQFYLEFGSGGSTRLAAELGVKTISIECDRFFARSVRDALPPPHQVTIMDIDIGLTGPWGVPQPGTPNPRRLVKWRRYIERPFANMTGFPDLVLVDGRFRRACALRCALAAREANASADLLFDDYYLEGRSTYQDIEALLGKPERIGKAAYFLIEPDNRITAADVESAMQDYR